MRGLRSARGCQRGCREATPADSRGRPCPSFATPERAAARSQRTCEMDDRTPRADSAQGTVSRGISRRGRQPRLAIHNPSVGMVQANLLAVLKRAFVWQYHLTEGDAEHRFHHTARRCLRDLRPADYTCQDRRAGIFPQASSLPTGSPKSWSLLRIRCLQYLSHRDVLSFAAKWPSWRPVFSSGPLNLFSSPSGRELGYQ